MPEIKELIKYASCRQATFPMCAFGTPYQKHTTIIYTTGLAPGLDDLDRLECTHSDHKERAGGSKDSDDTWNSAAAAAYPAELNLTIAYAIANLRNGITEPKLLPKISQRATSNEQTEFEREERADQRVIQRLASMSSQLTAPTPHQQPPLSSAPTPSAPSSREHVPSTPLLPNRARRLDLPSPIPEESHTPAPPANMRMQDIATPNRRTALTS